MTPRRSDRVVRAAFVCAGISAVFGFGSGAYAQTVQTETVSTSYAATPKGRLDQLFAQVLQDPANPELTLEYARLATEQGNYEAAITAMERLLFLNPSLSQVQLELGVLYYRVGANGLARSYLVKARALPDATADNKALIDRYLLDIDHATRQNRFSADVFAGVMNQSDANLSPGSGAISLPSGVVTLPSGSVKKADQAMVTSATGLYSYDLQDQDRTSIDVTGQLFASKHFRLHDFDLLYGETTVGPRTALSTFDITDFSIHPYFIADYSLLGGSELFHAFGAGIDAQKTLIPKLVLKGTFEFRDERFGSGDKRSTAPGLSGNQHSLAMQLSYNLTPTQIISLTGNFIDDAARFQSDAYRSLGATATYQIAYTPPFGIDGSAGSWQTALSAGRSISNYNEPDPTINASQARFDRQWRFSATQIIPITDRVAMNLQLQRDVVSSNIPLFAYTNTTVILGAQVHF